MIKKRFFAFILCLAVICAAMPVYAANPGVFGPQTLRILFTHDIHSYLSPTKADVNGTVRERGGAARLATLLKEYEDPYGCSIYIDGGDFSQGTLFQAGYEDSAYELRTIGSLGCIATTPGNHEWDHAGKGFAAMLDSAVKSGEQLPFVLCSNLDFSGELTPEQQTVKDSLTAYNKQFGSDSSEYIIYELPGNGLKLGIFGVSGPGSIEDAPTSGMNWENYIDSAKRICAELEDKCDMIICLSHSGTSGDGENGSDFDLLKEVPEIDFVLSGHSHSFYPEIVKVGDSYLASAGEYLDNLGVADFEFAPDGSLVCTDYKLLPIDENVKEDPLVAAEIEGYKSLIDSGYLSEYGLKYNQKIAHCGFNFMNLQDMYASHEEYPMGDLIADSYIYEAKKNGIDDIDVALVGLGTIRGSFFEGDIEVSDAFEICSLGAGSDGSAGHPLVSAYISGKELKLLVELDASLGPSVSSIKMSYSGLSYSFNTSRMMLDRVTEVHLVREDGSTEEIEDDKLYKVCCNMYAANMLGMLNGMTKGLLSIEPKFADGSPVTEFYDCAIKDVNGREIKEWYAFADYLSSFEAGESGLPEIPEIYADKQGRKIKFEEGGLAKVSQPGLTTLAVTIVPLLIILAVIWIVVSAKKRRKSRND